MTLNLLSSIAELCRQTAYAESTRYPDQASGVSQMHRNFTVAAWNDILKPRRCVTPGDWVLDIGAGDGYALELFEREKLIPMGLNLVSEDADACIAKGLACRTGDMHDLTEPWERQFQLVWGRHVFEHSPFPMLALSEAHRVLRPGGWLYAEMPAPGTACLHEMNGSHFSVHSQLMWTQLLLRAGFDVAHQDEIHFNTQVGDDIYYRWLCQRPKETKAKP